MPEHDTPNKTTTEDTDIQSSLYATREKIRPRQVHGMFAFLRTSAVFVLLGLYYFVPWLSWDGRQAVLLDLPARKFYLFGITLWPQDFIYLALLLIIAALTLFLFTALAGRLWCGYACPQTVWTEVFLWIERQVEGDRPKQMKLDKAPWSTHKITVKAIKHSLWLLFATYTGITFVGYFSPIDELVLNIINLSLGPWETFWIVFYSFATWGNAGFLREQVCIYMCPYARFQSAMFDENTMIISYDDKRGDPRGSRPRNTQRRSEEPKDKVLGDCINCTLCVQVCPTGIDIRDGLQYQCIGCAACIDVCDEVMEKMDYDKGLIKYTTLNALEGKAVKLFRPQIIIYALIIVAIATGLVVSLLLRAPLELDIIRDRNSLFRTTNEGLIENVYSLKVLNMDTTEHDYTLTVSGIPEMSVRMDNNDIHVPAGVASDVVVRLQVDPYDLKKQSSTVIFNLQAIDDASLSVSEEARFLGPMGAGTR
ncbi:MAG: cytochrome c oxidase accessory protein CcoG [Gammaproteobacteria bacterium]|nr:MAG: cytochrome c oxidase accessory protein CcoG [Gammaproteobacteria bacterium]